MATTFSLKDFLDSQTRPRTIESYRNGIIRFSKWFGKTPEEILQMRQDDLTKRPDENQVDYLNRAGRFERELVKYHKQALDRGISKNSARTYTVGVIQLFRHYKMPILLDNSQKKISRTFKTENSFPLSIEHVRKMFNYADTREKAILSLATDIGQRISDLLALKIEDLPPLDQEPPIPFQINTRKENVIAYPFLSEETVGCLKTYLDKMKNEQKLEKENNPYLFPGTTKDRPISDVWFNELIRKLAKSAGIPINGKKLSSHCFRKMFLSAAATKGYEDAAKKMVGKSIDQSLDTYYTTLNLLPAFVEIKKLLTIQNQNSKSSESVESLKSALSEMQKKIQNQDTIIKSITDKLIEVQPLIDFTNIQKEKLDDLGKIQNKVKGLNQEEYASFSSALNDAVIQKMRKLADSKGLTIEEYIVTLVKDHFDEIRGKKDDAQH
jgi:integrase